MTEVPPLTLTPAQMAIAHPAVTAKTEMVALGDATYRKQDGVWWLLDADKHHPTTKEDP